tara:strand:+ start:171 stop:467 length:297 start_codon:yes stop_codon:yes gene_type:complete
MNFLPKIFDKQAKFQPWLWEKHYGTFDHTKMQKQRAENEAENKYQKDRMQHGSKKVGHSKDSLKYKEFVKKAKDSTKLRRGEVKRYDKKKGKWVSNKD